MHEKLASSMKKLALSLLTVALTLPVAFAGPTGYGKTFKEIVVIEEDCVFRDYELSIDGFFAGVAAGGPRFHGGVGGGTGLNFFFLRYFGIGAEAWWYDNSGEAEHNFAGTLLFRYPICSLRLAPYALVGGGASLNGRAVGTVQVGGGLEWRFVRHVGLFVDGRAVIPGDSDANTFALMRSGLRFTF